MYKIGEREYPTKVVIASKESGCMNCGKLKMFLTMVVKDRAEGKYEYVYKEHDEQAYMDIVEKTGSMSVPIVYNIETGEHISGTETANVAKLYSLLGIEL